MKRYMSLRERQGEREGGGDKRKTPALSILACVYEILFLATLTLRVNGRKPFENHRTGKSMAQRANV